MSKDWFADVQEFERDVVKAVHPTVPTIQSLQSRYLRTDLIMEEIVETVIAIDRNDLVEIADGIADSIVVLLGTAITFGIDIRPIWDEVHRSNMTKIGGEYNKNGKLLKPPTFEPPKIEGLIAKQIKGEL